MTPSQLFNELEALIEQGISKFDKRTVTAQANMWASLFRTIKKLELSELGDILPNRFNLKLLRTRSVNRHQRL